MARIVSLAGAVWPNIRGSAELESAMAQTRGRWQRGVAAVAEKPIGKCHGCNAVCACWSAIPCNPIGPRLREATVPSARDWAPRKRRAAHVDLLPSLLQDCFERGVVDNLFKDRTPPDCAVERVVDISCSCNSWSSGHDAIIPIQSAFRKRMRPDPIALLNPCANPDSWQFPDDREQAARRKPLLRRRKPSASRQGTRSKLCRLVESFSYRFRLRRELVTLCPS